MVTRNKITILIAIIEATILSYQKSTRQKSKIITRWTYKSCMERGVELQARYPDARHTSDTSQQPVRRPPNKPTKKSCYRSADKNPHEAGNTEARPSAEVAHSRHFCFANEMLKQRTFNDSETLAHPTRDHT